jgi:hypothetical protein
LRVRPGLDSKDDRRRLDEVEQQIDRAVDLAARMGGLEAAQRKIQALEEERKALEACLSAGLVLPDPEALRARVLAYAADLRATVAGDPEGCRRAFKVLLAGRRMRVGLDAEGQFRVDGIFHLPIQNEPLPKERLDCVVAGDRFNRYEARFSTTRVAMRLALAA